MAQGGNILYDRRLARLEVVKPSLTQLADTVVVGPELVHNTAVLDADTDYTFLEMPAATLPAGWPTEVTVALTPRSVASPFKTVVVVPPGVDPGSPDRRFAFHVTWAGTELITLQTVYASVVLMWQPPTSTMPAGLWVVVNSTSTASANDRFNISLELTPPSGLAMWENATTCTIINGVLFVDLDVMFQAQNTGPHSVLTLDLPPELAVTEAQGTGLACVDDTGFLCPATVSALGSQCHLQVFMFDTARVYTCKGQFFAHLHVSE